MEPNVVYTTVSGNVTENSTVEVPYGNIDDGGGFSRYVELFLILLFVVVWLGSVVCFFTRWNDVSLMQPYGANLLYVPLEVPYGNIDDGGGFSRYVELFLILLFVVVWLGSVVCFFTRWNDVSLMQPYGANLLYVPRNLDSVTVVQKEEESVIYCR